MPPPLTPGGQSGIASWYGPGFHGNRTSNGEVYDQSDLTAAHPTLPFGTRVRVTSFDTGRAVDVRINDRGPFVGGRIIDLSYAAAGTIDMVGPGTAAVSLDPIADTEVAAPVLADGPVAARAAVLPVVSLPAVLYAVQAGAFVDGSRADALRSSLGAAHGDGYLSLLHTPESILYRVRLGPFGRREEAMARAEELAAKGVSTVVVEEAGR